MSLSVIVAFAIAVGAWEIYKNYTYDRWISEYQETGDLIKGFTVPSENEVLLWEYRPNASGKYWGAVIETNSFGYRDEDHQLVKDSKEKRLAFVGDSVTVGIGVDYESTFVRVFERLVNSRSTDVNIEVLSFAVDGYSGIQVAELVSERALRFRPDTIVYIMCINDFDLHELPTEKHLFFSKPEIFSLLTLEGAYQKFLRIIGKFEFHEYYFRKNQHKVLGRIIELNEMLAMQDISFHVVLMPIFPSEKEQYPLTHIHRKIVQKLSDAGVQVSDLGETDLAREPDSSKYARDIWHLNANGHKYVAEWLSRELLIE